MIFFFLNVETNMPKKKVQFCKCTLKVGYVVLCMKMLFGQLLNCSTTYLYTILFFISFFASFKIKSTVITKWCFLYRNNF